MSTLHSIANIGMRRASFRRLVWRLDTPAALAGMFALAFAIRLLIAPHAGYYADLKIFQGWSLRLDDVGLRHFYAQNWADYPPGYLYVLWLLGKISSPPGYVLLKVPAMLGDLALAWIACMFATRIAPASTKERWPVRPLVAAAVLFNPAVIMLSAVWGQVDVVPAVFVLWSLFLLLTGSQTIRRESAAFLAFAVAFTIKPQSGFVLPVMLYALYRRHGRHRPRPELWRQVVRVAVPAGLALSLWFLAAAPFGLWPIELVRFYRDAASVYPVTSAFAFNLWGAVGFVLPDSAGVQVIDGVHVTRGPVEFASLSALQLGAILLAAGAAVVLWRAHRALERGADEALVLAASAAATGLLAFSVLTRMHERYMFYALAFITPLVFLRPFRLVYVALSALYALNLWWVYAYNNSRGDLGHGCALPSPGCVGVAPLLGGFAMDAWQKKAFSATVVTIAVCMVWFGAGWAARRRAHVRTARQERPDSGVPSLTSPPHR
jgi:dolichyl-phosphate-mannose-protein mannosyltransferase